ncbi:MAG: sensor histidine kinase [Kiritimatiellia bacterium]
MNREIRLFLLVIGIPALLIAGAGMYLVRLELAHGARVAEVQRQEERRRQQFAQRREQMPRERGARRVSAPEKPVPKAHEAPREGRREGRRLGNHPPPGAGWFIRAFSDLEARREREMLIGGCVMGLLLLSLVAGAWLLAKSARKAREEAMRKTDFLSNISHEFKTPLTTICLCAELAQDDGLSPERRRKALASIVAESERLKRLVLNALDFSRLEKNRRVFSPVSCDVAQLAAAAGEPLRERFTHGLALPAESVHALADVTALQQIVVILLENAAKYAAHGGPVECRVAPVRERIELTVSDRGPGLDKEGLKHAFDRFWRGDDATTAETGGSGLGLAIARELARGMNGTLAVAPRAGGGLTFTLSLPHD